MGPLAALRDDIPLLSRIAYLDAAALSPAPRRVLDAWRDHLLAYPVNVERGGSRLASEAQGAWDRARATIARVLLRAGAGELVLTTGTTGAMNLALQAAPLEHGDSVVTTVAEHHAVLAPLLRRVRRTGAELRIAQRLDAGGAVDPAEVASLCDGRTRLLAIQHASNVTGALQPVAACARAARDASPSCLVAVDGAQMAGHAPVDVQALGCDLYAFSGHKGPLGPPGTGGLWIRRDLVDLLEPERLGGGAVEEVTLEGYRLRSGPKRFEPGTPDVASAVALAAGVSLLEEIGLATVEGHTGLLMAELKDGLRRLPGVTAFGTGASGCVSFVVEGVASAEVAVRLELEGGVHVRAGHHCAMPLHRQLGTLERHGGTVRASLHAWSHASDVEALLAALARIAP